MSTTPRTDNAWRRYNCAELPAPQELVKESSALETELAAASQAYDCAMAIHGTVLEDLAAEREKVRVLQEALENLLDEQNGAPLCTRETEWKEAMDNADAALAATKEGSK